MALAKETEARQLLQEQMREQQEQNRQESDKFLRQIDELRETLAANERTSARMEERMQREREDLMAKLQDSEARHEVQTGFFFVKSKVKSKISKFEIYLTVFLGSNGKYFCLNPAFNKATRISTSRFIRSSKQ